MTLQHSVKSQIKTYDLKHVHCCRVMPNGMAAAAN